MEFFFALTRFFGFRLRGAVALGLLTAVLGLAAGAPQVATLGLAAAPALLVAGSERLRLLWCWRRWVRTGRGPAGEWMSPVELKQYTRPLPRRLR